MTRRRRLALALAALVACGRADASVEDTCSRASSSAGASDRRRDATVDRFVVATLNARWLFDGVADVRASPYANGDASGARTHGRAIADVVRALDADVVVLTEAETCETLGWAANASGGVVPGTDTATMQQVGVLSRNASGGYVVGMVPGTDTATMQQVGVLSRVDFAENLWRTNDRASYDASSSACGTSTSVTSGVSKNVVARLRTPSGRYVSIIGAHLKANPTEPSSCAQREAQVEVLRALAKARFDAGDAVMVIGDLNDYSDLHRDAGNNAPISQCLKRLRDFDGDGIDELEEVGGLIAANERYTWQSGSNRAKLDYILTSRSDMDVISARIRHDLVNSSVSDHFPLVAVVDVLSTRNVSRLLASTTTRGATSTSAVFAALLIAIVLSSYLR